jgi:hypothetical protein
MSVAFQAFLRCDACGATYDLVAVVDPSVNYGPTIEAIRKQAARNGWTVWAGRVRSRRDFCPEHVR